MNFELPKAMPPQVNVDLNIKLANEQWRKDPAIGAFMSWFTTRFVTADLGISSRNTQNGRILVISIMAQLAEVGSCLIKFC